jgi:[acyl-carrier-protein] S-malonyltransferase
VAACVATAGLSLGEYTALTFAGVLTFEDGLRLVQERGRAMQVAADANPGAMVSVLGMSPEELEQVLEQARPAGLVEIANLLCPGNVVISGERPAVEAAERIADGRGARCIRLAVAGAFHTGLMDPARPPLAAALARTPFHAPKLPIWSNVDGKPHSAADEIKGLLLEQVSRPVLWEQSMRALLDLGVDRFYEVGPGRVLAGLMKRIVRKADVRNIPA